MECNKESISLKVGETAEILVHYYGDETDHAIDVGNFESDDPTFDITVDFDYRLLNNVPMTITADGIGYGELPIKLQYYGDDLEIIDTLMLPITITE